MAADTETRTPSHGTSRNDSGCRSDSARRDQPRNTRPLRGWGAILALLAMIQSASGGNRVAVVDTGAKFPNFAEQWCDLLETAGHTCTTFPLTGPDTSLAGFDVIIDLSDEWADPQGLLAEHVRSGKGVIVWGTAPHALGLDSNATVQAWIGANAVASGSTALRTVATDPLFGSAPVGTLVVNCGDSICAALDDTIGHTNAKALAVFDLFGTIGVLRNEWQSGQSVFLTDEITPRSPLHQDIILRAVNLVGPPIPTVSHWGLAVMTLLLLSAGSVVLKRKALEEVCW